MSKIWKMRITPDQFIADTINLTNEEIGVYFRLLCHAWKKKAYLPKDLERLQRIGQNCHPKIIQYLLDEYFTENEKGFYCKAQLKEWNWVQEKSDKATESVNKRWEYDRNTNNSNNNKNNKVKYTKEFLAVWNKLDIKVGSKKDSQKAFEKIKNNIDHKLLYEKYNFYLSTVNDPKYYKHFSSWLNSERYEEDIQLGEQSIRKINDLGSDHKYIGFHNNEHTFVYDMGFSKMNVKYDKKGKKIKL